MSGRLAAAAAAALLWVAVAVGLQGCGGGSDDDKIVRSVQITPAGGTVPYNGTLQLTASATYSDGSTATLNTGVTWSVTPASLISVSSSGLATGRLSGTAKVSAAFGGVTGTADFSVFAPFAEVSLGREHTLAVRTDGTLWAWGRNHWGQLGTGSTADSLVPVRVGTDANWRSVAVGESHSLAIRTNGELWAWGLNQSGQLGDNTAVNRTSPVKISAAGIVEVVAAGDAHSLVRRKDGTLWAWGRNAYGQLGLGNTQDKRIPTPVDADKDWVDVVAVANHTIARKSTGTLWAWGRNESSQLGLSTRETLVNRPTLIDFEDDAWRWIAVATGATHSLAVRSDGALFSWGSNANGRLGRSGAGPGITTQLPGQVGTDLTWVTVAAGGTHSLAIRVGGTMWSWGANERGQLGGGALAERSSTEQIGAGSNAPVPDWAKVRAGFNSSMALSPAGGLWAWGDDSFGQNGLGGSLPLGYRTALTKVD